LGQFLQLEEGHRLLLLEVVLMVLEEVDQAHKTHHLEQVLR
jgi:hypothetical protein